MIAALALLFFCGPARADAGFWRERLDQAERLSGEGNAEEAVKAAQGALADAEKNLGPENPEVAHILARLSRFYEAEGDISRLPEIDRRLSAIKSKDFEVWFALGKLRHAEGRNQEAEEALKKSLALKPDDPDANLELAQIFEETSRFEDEIRLLRELIKNKSSDHALYFELAKAYTRLDRSAEAQETFAQARKLGGKTSDAYIREGYFYLGSNEQARSKEAFESAISIDSASPVGYHHLATYFSESGQYPEAEKYFQKAREMMEAHPDAKTSVFLPETLNRLGDVIREQGRGAEAEPLYLKGLEKAISGSDEQLQLFLSLADFYASQGKSAQAEATYKRAADVCEARFKCQLPAAGRILIELGQLYLKEGRRAEAEAMAGRAEKACADVPVEWPLFVTLRRLAGFYSDLGDDAHLDALYARLLPVLPTMPFNPALVWVETGLADRAAAQGRFREAEDRYRQAIGILDHNGLWKKEADALDELAAIYDKDGKDEEAVKAAQGALAQAEKNFGPEDRVVVRILTRLSRYCEAAGDVVRFSELDKRLSAVQTKDFDVWFALGTLRRGEGLSREAEAALKTALAFKPDEPGVKIELASVYDDMGRFDEELPLLKEMTERRPRNISPYFQLARTYTRLGRAADAEATYARLRKLDGMTAADYIKEGYFDLSSGEPLHARESFESAIAVDTSSPIGYHHMGSFWAHRGRYPEAEKYFRHALEKLEADPNASADDVLHSTIWLGKVIHEQGRDDEAEAVYRKGLEKAPPGGEYRLELLWSLAKLYASQGKSAQAEETYKRTAAGCEAGVKYPFCQYYAGEVLIELGRYYLKEGRGAEAEATAERAVKSSEDSPIDAGRFQKLRDVSILYASLGATSKNEALYARLLPMRRAMPFNPDLVWVETGLAVSAASQGRFSEAEDRYRQAIDIMEHNRRWQEEAGLLDELAAIYEKGGKAGAVEAKEKAKALRARP